MNRQVGDLSQQLASLSRAELATVLVVLASGLVMKPQPYNRLQDTHEIFVLDHRLANILYHIQHLLPSSGPLSGTTTCTFKPGEWVWFNWSGSS